MMTTKVMSGANGGVNLLNLLDAPDKDIGTVKPTTKAPQAIRISLTQETVLELQKQTKAGKSTIQLLLGKSPQLRHGPNTTQLNITPTKFRSELYERDSENIDDWHFKALISHSAIIRKAEIAAQQADTALARLQATMAIAAKEKEENNVTFIDKVQDPNKMSKPPRASTAIIRKAMLNPNGGNGTSSLLASPAVNASKLNTPNLSATPRVSAKVDPEMGAMRHSILHLLAIRPLVLDEIINLTKSPREALKKALWKLSKEGAIRKGAVTSNEEAAKNDGAYQLWELQEKAYKEIKPWDFRYKDEERQEVIDNAIRAFDRQRVSREDKLWQQLLPKEERGKGKCLSRLNLLAGSSGRPASAPQAHDITKKLNSPRPQPKKVVSDEKDSSKGTAKQKKAPESAKTITGSAQAPTGQKRKLDNKFKSAERIVDSSDEGDDEVGDDEVDVSGSQPKEADERSTKRAKLEHKSSPAIKPPALVKAASNGKISPNNPPKKVEPTPLAIVKSKGALAQTHVPTKGRQNTVAPSTEKTRQPDLKATPKSPAPAIAKSISTTKAQALNSHTPKETASNIKPKPANVAKAAAAAAPPRHSREQSTASSSRGSISDKSTPMHRVSSSQSSVSIRPSDEMPTARKRPATSSSASENPPPAKRSRADTLASEASPPNVSSPLSDIAASVSSPGASSSSLANEVAQKGSNSSSQPASVNGRQLSPELQELEKLRAEYRSQFLEHLNLRVKLDQVRDGEREELKKDCIALGSRMQETRRAIRKHCIDMAEEEYNDTLPKGIEVEGETKVYLIKKLCELQKSYEELHDELEVQGDKEKPDEKLKAAHELYHEVQQLRRILKVD